MDALIGYDDEDQNVLGNEEGSEPGATPRPDQNPGNGVQIGPYMDKCFLGAISSFKTPEPLNDENWVAWKGQISPMLKLNQVWVHCEGPDAVPDLDDAQRPIWDTAQDVACVLISNNSVPQFVHISQAVTIRQMWESLKSVHEHHGQQSITALRHTLYQAWAKDGDDIVTHLTKMHSIQAQLHQMGSRIPDGDFTNILVSSLPASWDPFTTSYLRSKTGDKVLTLQQFIAIIHNECNRQKSPNRDIETMETALTALSSKCTKKRKAIEKEREKRTCHICGRDNHLTKDCFFKGKPKCTNGGRFNHETSKCRSAEKGKGKSMTTINSVTTQNRKCHKVEHVQQAHNIQEDKEMEDGMYVTKIKQSSNYADINTDSWLADSAASSHLSNKRETFIEFTPLNKSIRGVGNTDVPVKGRGTVKLKSRTNGQTFVIVLQDVLYVPQAPNNLLSISRLDESSRHMNMGDGCIHLYDKNKNLIAVGRKVE